MFEDRRPVGSPTPLSHLRSCRLLRQLSRQARNGSLPSNRSSHHPKLPARRILAVVLYRQSLRLGYDTQPGTDEAWEHRVRGIASERLLKNFTKHGPIVGGHPQITDLVQLLWGE